MERSMSTRQSVGIQYSRFLPLGIMVLALLIRIYHQQHILMSDEANNMLTIKSLIEGEGFRQYFFIHPPLFLAFSALIVYLFGDNHHIVQGLSIVFSTLSFIPFYMIVKEMFEKRTAIFATFFLAVMPLNIIYSTWVKPEGMLLFLFLVSFYLYITGRPWKSGMVLGIASLTKEFAWFLVPIVLGWEVLIGWEGVKSIRRFFLWIFIGSVMSAWWYLFFGGSFKIIMEGTAGGNLFEYMWHFPWYYYLSNLPSDLGIFLLPLFIFGLFSFKRDSGLLFILWILSFYLSLSFIKVKAPWYIYLASPAMAVIAAAGFLNIWDCVMTKWLRLCIVVAIMAVAGLSVFNLSSTEFFGSKLARRSATKPVFYEKEYLSRGRELFKGEGRVAVLSYNPALQYYLGIYDRELVYLGPQFPAMNRDTMTELASKEEIGWIVIDLDSVNYVERSIKDLTFLWGRPIEIGRLLVFPVAP